MVTLFCLLTFSQQLNFTSTISHADQIPDLPAASAPMDKPLKVGQFYGIKVADTLIPEMVSIPTGTFNMGQANANLGCHECSQDEQPVHRVEITAFEIGRFEVTNAQYEPFANATGRQNAEWRQYYKKERGNHPVVNVTWNDAQAYCAWLQALTGQEYRLPTEAEWEYAARAWTNNRYIFSNELSSSEANFDNKKGAVEVGRYRPNRFGLYDMLGNVWEWCADWYDEKYYGNTIAQNPPGPNQGQYRVLRGCSWLSTSDQCRIANRAWYNPGYILDGRGFRIALRRRVEKP
ncbi:MAG: formylglycine-generating enzyme family protein [Acidobacteriota bacterium]